MKFAPVALFVFNRPSHTEKTLRALMANPGFAESPVFVFSDGPRNADDAPTVLAVRQQVKSLGLPNLKLIEREQNLGLARSIIRGVTELTAEFGRVIVLEDDLLVSRHFLAYMNESLRRFEAHPEVLQISGHCFKVRGYEESLGSSFLPQTSSWGWATWKRAWDHFDPDLGGYQEALSNRAMRRRFDLDGAYSYSKMIADLKRKNEMNRSWAVRWYWSVFKINGLVLFPHATLVKHFGTDDSGTNVRGKFKSPDDEFDVENRVSSWPDRLEIDKKFYTLIKRTIASEQSLPRKIMRYCSRWI
jgi:hypothetical protein